MTQPWQLDIYENHLQLVEHFSTWRGPQSNGVGWLTQTTGPSASEKVDGRDFLGGPVVKTPIFHCRGTGLIPGWRAKILHAEQLKKERTKERKKCLLWSRMQEMGTFI